MLDVWWEPKKPTLAATPGREYQRVIDTRRFAHMVNQYFERM